MKLLREYVVVKVPDDIFNREKKSIGVNGTPILIDHTFNPALHVKTFGIVVSVPILLPKVPIANNSIGRPAYSQNPPYTWKTAADIEMDVQVGDKVYFHYNCLLPDNPYVPYNVYYLYTSEENGRTWYYYRVKYELITTAVRYHPLNSHTPIFNWDDEDKIVEFWPGRDIDNEEDQPEAEPRYMIAAKGPSDPDFIYRKEIVMIGSYVLVEPDIETWDDILLPIPETINGKVLMDPATGKPILKPKDQWLATKPAPENKYLSGWVRHVGKPLKGDRADIKVGMYVYTRPLTENIQEIEGKGYFVLRQRHITGFHPGKSAKNYERLQFTA